MVQTRRPWQARPGWTAASLSAILVIVGACAQGPVAAVAPVGPSIEMRIAQAWPRG